LRASEEGGDGFGFGFGFTHFCGKRKDERFWLRRKSIAKRVRAKLKAVNEQLKRRRHEPIPVQGHIGWLARATAPTS
jgi:hypothetical protein